MKFRVSGVLAVSAGLLSVVVGCASERPLHQVRTDAEFAYKVGNYQKSVDDWAVFVARRPHDKGAYYSYGNALMKANRPGDAATQYALALDAENRPLEKSIYTEAYAEALFASNQREKLTEILKRRASERQDVETWGRYGRFAARMGNADEAKDALTRAAALDGGQNLQPQYDLAQFYLSINDQVNARRRLAACYYLAPKDEQVLAAIKQAGEIAGPTFAAVPPEMMTNQPSGTTITNVPPPAGDR